MIALTECQLKQSFISLLIVFKLRTMQKEKENLVTKNRRHCKKEDFWGRWAVSMTPGSQKYFAPSDIKPAVWTGSILLLICTPPLSAYCYTNPSRSPPTLARCFLMLSYRRNRPNSPRLLAVQSMVTTDSPRTHQLWDELMVRLRRPERIVSSGLPEVIKGSVSIWLHIKGLPAQWQGEHVWVEGCCHAAVRIFLFYIYGMSGFLFQNQHI